MFSFKNKKPIYADYASSTPLDEGVLKDMLPYLKQESGFGNPSSIHFFGREAKEAVEKSRKDIARIFQVKSDEIVFTSGGTESNNLAILGVVKSFSGEQGEVITTKIEHSSTLEPIKHLESLGHKVTYLSVDNKGRISLSDLEKSINKETCLVSVAHSNAEIGSVERIHSIGVFLKKFKESQPIYFHTDGSQAFNYEKILPSDSGIDLMSIDGSKIYGPKGMGFLFVKRGTPISPIIRGGMQERGLRAGTENVASIVGLASAIKKADSLREKEIIRVKKLRDKLKSNLEGISKEALFNGEGDMPNTLNICIPGIDAEFFAVRLDKEGVAASSASACRSISGSGSSYVIEALPGHSGCSRSSIRISLGRFSREKDISFITKAFEKLLNE